MIPTYDLDTDTLIVDLRDCYDNRSIVSKTLTKYFNISLNISSEILVLEFKNASSFEQNKIAKEQFLKMCSLTCNVLNKDIALKQFGIGIRRVYLQLKKAIANRISLSELIYK